MNIYHQLIENPLFFKWIYHPSPEINTYWEYYLKKHSDNAKIIRDFKAGFEAHLKYKNHQLTDKEKKELAVKILKKIEKQDKKHKHKTAIRTIMKYAAVSLFFLFTGSGITYYFLKQQHSKQLAGIPAPINLNMQQPALLIDNKTGISLKQGESNVEYSSNGDITVDNQKIANEKNTENVTMNTLVIPYGNRSTVLLADGTKVWLNAGSRLLYPSKFKEKERRVFLIGEAFFQVAKNEQQPFCVSTPDIKIKVTGTQFNISAYSDDNIVQTLLTEGSIELSTTKAGILNKRLKMKPGEMVIFSKKDKKTDTYSNVNIDYYTGWKEGYLTFNNSDLSRVVKKLERYFNINFKYANPMDGTIKISGKLIVSDGKEDVLDYMRSLTKLNFIKINENNYIIK